MKNTKRLFAAVMALTMAAGSAVYASADTTTKTLDATTTSDSTNVNYSVDPSYAVIIPASVTLSDTATTEATISATGLSDTKPFKLGSGQTLSVKIADVETNDFKVTCGTGTDAVAVPYTVTAGTTELAKGSTAAEFTNDDKTAKTLTFSQIDSTLATVAGDYTGTLTFGIELEDASTPVTAITLNKTATSIKVGSTETLSVTAVAPDNATDKTYTWKTSDASIATVDQDGKVTAVAAGTVTIYAEANDGSGVKGNCTVTVTPATITVTINQSDWGWDDSFTKDGVTVSANLIDPDDGNLIDGTFSTTLGNFTKIVVTTEECDVSGTGWSGSSSSMTWAGTPASTVSFSGEFMGMGLTQTTIVCTIEPTN